MEAVPFGGPLALLLGAAAAHQVRAPPPQPAGRSGAGAGGAAGSASAPATDFAPPSLWLCLRRVERFFVLADIEQRAAATRGF